MFKTKYHKCLDILDEEIDEVNDMLDSCYGKTYDDVEDPEMHDLFILDNLDLMDKYLDKLEALCKLKRRFKSEIGM